MAGSFYDAIVSLLGQPNSFAAEIIIYTIIGIIFIRIFEGIIGIIFTLIRGVR